MSITAPPPRGFIYSWIDTGLPGARKMTIASTDYTAAENYSEAPTWLGLVNTAISAGGHGLTFSTTTGLCTLTLGSATTCEWADRTGFLCGFDRDPTTIESFTTLTSRVIPPAMVWLVGAIWEEIELRTDRELEIVRHRRGYGYRFGGNRVYRLIATMHRDALVAFDKGWSSTGKITIYTGDATELSGSNNDGKITGHVLAVEDISWIDPVAEYAEITMLLARAR